ncbi:hypothetical protein HCN44_008364 [Aphidius gifuensis]|uniref:Cuticular protein n=1 Tax=Aphidius gifuensis TaxID=684658 RepID=A0A835CR05_APHGI|nr:larval cuticle protein LCP-14-like [Aphidius gifuensis]KAF7989690.1 hypothetical protein HCN44_008364 [Aphidius gifuensis]
MLKNAMIGLILSIAICIVQSAKIPVGPHVHHDHVPVGVPTTEPIAILSQNSEVNPDGTFYNVWESQNGIKVQEEGTVKVLEKNTIAQSVTGEISWVDHDGTPFNLKYTADENGYRPEADFLPTSPPIPIGIARGLEWIKTHPYVEKNQQTDEQHVELPIVESN